MPVKEYPICVDYSFKIPMFNLVYWSHIFEIHIELPEGTTIQKAELSIKAYLKEGGAYDEFFAYFNDREVWAKRFKKHETHTTTVDVTGFMKPPCVSNKTQFKATIPWLPFGFLYAWEYIVTTKLILSYTGEAPVVPPPPPPTPPPEEPEEEMEELSAQAKTPFTLLIIIVAVVLIVVVLLAVRK